MATGSCTFINLLPSYDRMVASVQHAHGENGRGTRGWLNKKKRREEKRRTTENTVEESEVGGHVRIETEKIDEEKTRGRGEETKEI